MIKPDFNYDRAMKLKPSPFSAFDVEDKLPPLADALNNGDIKPEQSMLIAERENAVIVLDRQEMSYHHVAQGDMNGEPWMVAF